MRQTTMRMRNPRRAKGGLRVKHVLPICLLFATILFLFLHKHSYVEIKNAKVDEEGAIIFKLDRRDLWRTEESGGVEIEEGQQDQERADGKSEHGEEFAEGEDLGTQAVGPKILNNEGHGEREGVSMEAREGISKRADASSEREIENMEKETVDDNGSMLSEHHIKNDLQTNSTMPANNHKDLPTNSTANNPMETQSNFSEEVDVLTDDVPLLHETVKLESVRDRNANAGGVTEQAKKS